MGQHRVVHYCEVEIKRRFFGLYGGVVGSVVSLQEEGSGF